MLKVNWVCCMLVLGLLVFCSTSLLLTMALTTGEKDQLSAIFQEMGMKPKADTVEDFEGWMKDYLSSKGKLDSSVQIVTHPPQIVKFSGESKGDMTTFDLWKYEVKSLMKEGNYKLEAIHQAVRRSLRGEASRIAMRLGSEASLEVLLQKLESVYGTIEFGEDILAQFYSATQMEDEDVVAWGFKLENILDKAIEQKQLTPSTANGMLKSKFWSGLRQDLKDATRHYYETVDDFDRLRVLVRRVEQEHTHPDSKVKKDKKTVQSKMVHASNTKVSVSEGKDRQIEELKQMMLDLSSKVETLQKNVDSLQKGQKTTAAAQPGVGIKPPLVRERVGSPGQASASNTEKGDEPLCYKCGRLGHLSFGCRAKQPLNMYQPMGMGHQ